MDFETAAEIGADGSVSLPLSHASQYAIVIDDHSHAATDVSEIFTDVPANHWAQAAIQYVYDNGLMTGVSDSEFAPEATTTRAMIVSMLARLENVTSAADAGFADVAVDDWYATAVNWAAANGIVNGISDDTFAPKRSNHPRTARRHAHELRPVERTGHQRPRRSFRLQRRTKYVGQRSRTMGSSRRPP